MADEKTETEMSQTPKTFTQEEVNNLIKAARMKETESFKEKLNEHVQQGVASWREEQGITDDILEKLSKVETTVAEARKVKSEATKISNEFSKTQERLNKVQGKLFEALTRDSVFKIAADKCDARQLKHLWLDLQPRLKVDENTFQVFAVDDKGERDDSLTLDTLVEKTLEENPHLARPMGNTGSGAQGSALSRGNGAHPKTPSERKLGDEADFLKAKLGELYKT